MMHATKLRLDYLLPTLFVGLLLSTTPETLGHEPANTSLPPTSYEQLWDGYDPRAEPLDIEVLKTWEQDSVAFQVVRYRAGTFKGKPAMVAAIFGYPKDQINLPGLVQIHGGGQYADANSVLTNAKRGYATISIAWAGRINAPGYRVDPKGVKLFWDKQSDAPGFLTTTDWGLVDGYHAPSKNPGNAFPSINAHPWTIDSVESPRNSGWFLAALAARRALTFLEEQPCVDSSRLGVYGHSMGGKLTVLTATDPRVKAAAPSCGGVSDRDNKSALFRATLGDDNYLKRITCPIFFLSPANDFHGRIDDLQLAVDEIQSNEWRITCAPHHNHQDNARYEVATQLWFDQHLKGDMLLPQTPVCEFDFENGNGRAQVKVTAPGPLQVTDVEVFYTRHGKKQNQAEDRDNTIARFWYHLPVTQAFDGWKGSVDIHDPTRPFWLYANVTYQLPKEITGAGYYYRTYSTKTCTLSSRMQIVSPEDLVRKGVTGMTKRTHTIEDFDGLWRKQWFTYREEDWPIRTHKVYEPRWKAPSEQSKLVFEVQSNSPNSLVVGIDDFVSEVSLVGGSAFQQIALAPSDFSSGDGQPLSNWSGIRELRFGYQERLRTKTGSRIVGRSWNGQPPKFKALKWN